MDPTHLLACNAALQVLAPSLLGTLMLTALLATVVTGSVLPWQMPQVA